MGPQSWVDLAMETNSAFLGDHVMEMVLQVKRPPWGFLPGCLRVTGTANPPTSPPPPICSCLRTPLNRRGGLAGEGPLESGPSLKPPGEGLGSARWSRTPLYDGTLGPLHGSWALGFNLTPAVLYPHADRGCRAAGGTGRCVCAGLPPPPRAGLSVGAVAQHALWG